MYICVNRKGGVIARSYDKSCDNAPPSPPTLVAYAGLQKKGAYLRDNTVITIKIVSKLILLYVLDSNNYLNMGFR